MDKTPAVFLSTFPIPDMIVFVFGGVVLDISIKDRKPKTTRQSRHFIEQLETNEIQLYNYRFDLLQ